MDFTHELRALLHPRRCVLPSASRSRPSARSVRSIRSRTDANPRLPVLMAICIAGPPVSSCRSLSPRPDTTVDQPTGICSGAACLEARVDPLHMPDRRFSRAIGTVPGNANRNGASLASASEQGQVTLRSKSLPGARAIGLDLTRPPSSRQAQGSICCVRRSARGRRWIRASQRWRAVSSDVDREGFGPPLTRAR